MISVFIRRCLAGLAILVFGSTALAAVPESWWVDIANDRVAQVEHMLAAGVDPNERSQYGQPAIMQAVRDGAWNVYDLLASNRKTDLNAVNINNETPLMYLAVVGETARAKTLIQRGAQVNRLGWTPLHYAASKAHLDTARLLINHQAIINAPGPDGTTPLMMAAYSGSTDMVQLLLDVGADATAVNLQQQNAADWARLKSHTSLGAKLDSLAQKVQAERSGQTRIGKSQPKPDSASKPVQSEQEKSSTSRYFDLDRFK